MPPWFWIVVALSITLIVAIIAYWLIVITEGIYLGRRVVVWLYDITAHKYEGIKQFDPELERFFLTRPMLDRIRDLAFVMVLDVATGTGRLPDALVNHPGFAGHIVGLDASRRMLAEARQKLESYPEVELLLGNAVRLPFPDESFDVVSCVEALEFLPSVDAALVELVRVLRPDGLLLLTRRTGWEAKTFLGRYDDKTSFKARLQALGLIHVQIEPWQVDYNLVFGVKPGLFER